MLCGESLSELDFGACHITFAQQDGPKKETRLAESRVYLQRVLYLDRRGLGVVLRQVTLCRSDVLRRVLLRAANRQHGSDENGKGKPAAIAFCHF